MPTCVTTHTGGITITRGASLLSAALSYPDPSSPAYYSANSPSPSFPQSHKLSHSTSSPTSTPSTRSTGPAPSLVKLKQEGHVGFDLVLIDADKPSYRDHAEQVIKLGLLKENGVILADKTLYKVPTYVPSFHTDHPWAPPALTDRSTYAESNRTNNKSKSEPTKGIDDHPDRESAVLPFRDGITIIRRCV
ncbi:hypothetical protein JCM10295v2_004108 [Rhodotorula toruloides]